MNRVVTLLVLLCLVFNSSLLAAGPIVEAAGGFSYTPPKGWQTREFPESKYKIAHSAPVNGFAPNINVVDETFPGTISDYAKVNLQNLRTGLADFKLLRQTAFTTGAGLKGLKLVIQSNHQGRTIRQVFYALPGKGAKKYVVTFSAPAEVGSKYDSAVDAALKTFRVR